MKKFCYACNGTGYYDSTGSPKCSCCDGLGEYDEPEPKPKLWIIGIRGSSESYGSRVSIFGVATNETDAIKIFDEMKNNSPIYEEEESYEMWEVEQDTYFKFPIV